MNISGLLYRASDRPTVTTRVRHASESFAADFSYEQNARVTGGALAGAMKVAAVFSKQAREPMRTTIAVKGSKFEVPAGYKQVQPDTRGVR